ncbi:MAG: hypothetical protein V1800_17400 [Candidatus Latescibacterota bacterium]
MKIAVRNAAGYQGQTNKYQQVDRHAFFAQQSVEVFFGCLWERDAPRKAVRAHPVGQSEKESPGEGNTFFFLSEGCFGFFSGPSNGAGKKNRRFRQAKLG